MGPLSEKFGAGLEASGSYSANPPSHPNGSHVCELEARAKAASAAKTA